MKPATKKKRKANFNVTLLGPDWCRRVSERGYVCGWNRASHEDGSVNHKFQGPERAFHTKREA